MNSPSRQQLPPALCGFRQGSIPLAQKGMFLFSTSIQTGKNVYFPGHPRTTTAERGWDPPWTQQLCFRWSQHSAGECAAGRRTGNRPAAQGWREETQSYDERGFIQEETRQQLTHPAEKHAGAFQVGMWVPWPPGGERSGEMESTAHTLT